MITRLRLIPTLRLLLLSLSLAAALLLLARLDLSKGWLESLPLKTAVDKVHSLELGGLSWDPVVYRGRPELEPFAILVRKHCPNQAPMATAICLSSFLAERFDHGAPHSEFFDVSFSPVAALQNHLAGEPGHCVTRSGIIATALLASGIPARVVQLTTARGGHNAIEVFNSANEWNFFDPTYGAEPVPIEGVPGSAATLISSHIVRGWRRSSGTPPKIGIVDLHALYASDSTPAGGQLTYPEPWLYTRVDRKAAPPPFFATFLLVGSASWQNVLARRALLIFTTLNALLLAYVALRAFISPPNRVDGADARWRIWDRRAQRHSGIEHP